MKKLFSGLFSGCLSSRSRCFEAMISAVSSLFLVSLFVGLSCPVEADAAVVYQDTPNTANMVLICRFSDDNYDDYNSELYAGKTKWAALLDSFNSDDPSVGEFRNYVLTASGGRLNVESIFPQDLNGNKMEYLDLDISSDEYVTANDDQKLFESISRAFNTKYSDKFNASKAAIESRGLYYDNVMVGLQMPNESGKEITSHEGNGSAFGDITLGRYGYRIGEYEVLQTSSLGGWSGSLDAVPAHEYLHSRGAIDLYKLSGSSKPAAYWDIMASAVPSLLPLAVTRDDMGWGDVNFVDSGEYELGTYTSGSRYAVAFKSSMNDDEYFVAEYRKGDVPGANGYKADKRLGNKSSFDSSGSKDGLIVYRVSNRYGTYKRGGDGTGNRTDRHDYIYIFRNEDSSEENPGGDGAASIYDASLKPGQSYGSTDVSAGIHDNALCFSDGTNSMIKVSVESVDGEKLRMRLDIPEYDSNAFWDVQSSTQNNAKSFDAIGATHFSTAVEEKYTSWGGAFYSASGYGIHKVIRSDGDKWSLFNMDENIIDSDIVENGDEIYDVSINSSSFKINRYTGSPHTPWELVVSGQVTAPNLVRAYSVDNTMNIIVVDENNTRAVVYTYSRYSGDKINLKGTAVTGTYINDAAIMSNGDLVVGDFFGKKLRIYSLENNSWHEFSTINMSPRTITVGTDIDGNDYVLATNGESGSTSKIYKIDKNNNISEQSSPLIANDEAKLSSSDGNLYLSVSRAVNGVNTSIAYARGASGEWQQLGERIATPSPDISPISVINGKAQVLTSNGSGTMRLRTHDAFAPVIPSPPSDKITVTFYPQNGEPSKSVSYNNGDSISFYTPKRDGYDFIGWSESLSDGNIVTSASATKNISYYAQWKKQETTQPDKPAQTKYIIAFDSRGGSYIAPITAESGKKLFLPIPTRIGYEFTGWLDSSTYKTYGKTDYFTVDGNKTLQATWKLKRSDKCVTDGQYIIGTLLGSNSTIDIENGSRDNCANARLWDMNFSCAQRYTLRYDQSSGYYEIINVNSGKALDVKNAAARSGQNVWQYERNNTNAQRWGISRTDNGYVITSALDDSLALSVSGGSSRAGSNLLLAKRDGTRKQCFTMNAVNPLGQGTYRIKTALSSHRALDISCASREPFANAQLWDANGTAAQDYNLVKMVGEEYYEIVNANSGKALDIKNGWGTNGSNVQQYNRNWTPAQQWLIVDMGNGKYVIASALQEYALDVSCGNPSAGNNVQIWESNGSTAQRWNIEKK